MDLRTIRYFLAVADAGSITDAAKSLHLSQPPLSTAIMKLESELGVSLLERLPRGVSLTPAGEYLQITGRRLIAEEQRLSAALRAMGQGLEGDLRVGAEPMGLWRIVSSQIATFLRAFPKVSIEIVDASPRVQLESLANGYLDLAIIPVLPQEPLPPIADVHFSVEIIATLPLTVIAPRTSEMIAGGPVSLARLREYTWVLPGRLPGARSLSRIIDDRFADIGGTPGKIIPVPTVQTAANLVAAGLGVSVLSDEMVDSFPGVVRVAVDGGWPDLPLAIVRRRDGIVTPIADRFARLFRAGESAEDRPQPTGEPSPANTI